MDPRKLTPHRQGAPVERSGNGCPNASQPALVAGAAGPGVSGRPSPVRVGRTLGCSRLGVRSGPRGSHVLVGRVPDSAEPDARVPPLPPGTGGTPALVADRRMLTGLGSLRRLPLGLGVAGEPVVRGPVGARETPADGDVRGRAPSTGPTAGSSPPPACSQDFLDVEVPLEKPVEADLLGAAGRRCRPCDALCLCRPLPGPAHSCGADSRGAPSRRSRPTGRRPGPAGP